MNNCCDDKMHNKEYDLIIIGGGAAAFAAANKANQLKKRTLVINDKNILPLGGTCVNVGCIPSKILLHQGKEAYYPVRSKFDAVKLTGSADFLKAIKQTQEMVEFFRAKNYYAVIKKQQFVDFKEGRASFVDSHTIKVGDALFKGRFILIATGAFIDVPNIKGIETVDYLTNVNIFELSKAPKSIIVLGGGPLGVEFSQIFHHFGIKVTLLQRSSRLIPRFDFVLGESLQSYLEDEGITIYTNANTKQVTKLKEGVEVIVKVGDGEITLRADKIMLATGIMPNTKDMGLENAQVSLDDKGFVKVDEYLQTSQNNIYAAGDVTGLLALETVAAKQGNTAVMNMFENAKKVINYDEIPRAVFTSPEVAAVGITEEDQMKKYGVCMCKTITLDYVEKAAAIKDTRGLIKMVLDPETKVVIGVHMIGQLAADIITTATYIIKNKMTIYDIRDTVHVFPTLSEVIKKAAQSFDQNLDDMACCVE